MGPNDLESTRLDLARRRVSRSRPPIGLKPENLHQQQRALDILEAMERYIHVRKPIPKDWFIELHRLYGEC